MRPSSFPQRVSRGFTLVELLVALTGGLFVSIAVFALARDASRFYQREGRLANATFAGLVGFERLRADLARAGFLSSPNVQADPSVCSRPTTPSSLANLASILVTNEGSVTSPKNSVLENNGLEPDSVLLTGSYSSADEFPVRTITTDGTGNVTVYLQERSGPMARLGFVAANAANRQQLLSEVFTANRVLRIVDNEGRQHYGAIVSAQVDPGTGGTPTIVVTNSGAIQFRSGASQFCGLKGLETGAMVNVVNFIRYDIRSLAGSTAYKQLYDTSYEHDANRTELVRTEVGVDGADMVQELAAEYAVDLQLDFTAITNGPTMNPNVAFVPSTATQFASLTTAPTALGARPQDVRAVRARLSVRSREGDRDTNITTVPGTLYRVGLGPNGGAPFARVRTLQADIMLNNHTRVQW